MNSASKYFYDLEHLGSVREMTDNTGAIQAQYAFDPFGRASKISETVASDFSYASYYFHLRSGLNLTSNRQYSPVLSRWLSRDLLEESEGTNLYSYVSGDPISFTDPSGLRLLKGGVSVSVGAPPPPSPPVDDGHCLRGHQGPAGWVPPREGTEPDPSIDLLPMIFLIPASRFVTGTAEPGPLFSIVDWSGYPAGVPRPTGPFGLTKGPLYDTLRRAATNMNRRLNNTWGETGFDMHEIQPVKFGGDPTGLANKMQLDKATHSEVTQWWNNLQRYIEARQ